MSVNQARLRLDAATDESRSQGLSPELAPTVLDARRDLAEAKIDEFVTKTVASAPPLTGEQRARLAALFDGGVRP